MALAQLEADGVTSGYLLLRDELYNPIRQDAVVMAGSRNQKIGQKFLSFVLDAPQQEVIQSAGYYRGIDPAVERVRERAKKQSKENG